MTDNYCSFSHGCVREGKSFYRKGSILLLSNSDICEKQAYDFKSKLMTLFQLIEEASNEYSLPTELVYHM